MNTNGTAMIRVLPGKNPEHIRTKSEAAEKAGYKHIASLNYFIDSGRPARDGALYYTAEMWETIQRGEAEQAKAREQEHSPATWPFDPEETAEPVAPEKQEAAAATVVTVYPKAAQRFIRECRESLSGLPSYISKRLTVSAEKEAGTLSVVCALELPRGGTFFSDGDYLHNRGWMWVESDDPLQTIRFERREGFSTGKAVS